MRDSKSWIAVLAILLIGIAYVGCTSAPPANTNQTTPVGGNVTANATGTTNTTTFTPANAENINLDQYPALQQRLQSYNAIKVSKRPNYFGNLQDQVFQYLPPFPRDFYWIATMVQQGLITDVNSITADYYKQPEFYPRFDTNGVDMMRNPVAGRYGAWGFGTYPSEVLLDANVNDTTGVETTAYTIIYASWLVETYQGMKLEVTYPASGNMLLNQFSDGSRGVTQDPATVSQYFETQFVKVEPTCETGAYADGVCEWSTPQGAGCYAAYNETTQLCSYTPPQTPDVLLLEPSYPIFQAGWAQKVGLDIKVKPGTPKGKYLIGLGISAPPKDVSDRWLNEYKLAYAQSGMFGVGVPWFQVFVQVN